ncbi:MAG TPA: AAA family ATPase [Candidatus Xenobia bacterium]|nr:AAA family ATPase [Candidatus Xenobia bacterium]
MKHFESVTLPAETFDPFWQSIVAPRGIKEALLGYARIILSLDGASPLSTGINRFLYFFGPPGTGKTTLAKGFANQLAKAAKEYGHSTQLFHANAECWRSELFGATAKEITKAFEAIRVATADGLTLLLIDELESVAIGREYTLTSHEPSDAISGVNTLLNELDSLASNKNFLLLATSNFEQAIDRALRSRADLEIYLTPPGYEGALSILKDTYMGIRSAGLDLCLTERQLSAIARKAEGLSGRSLRKLFIQVLSATHKPLDQIGAEDFFEVITQLKRSVKGG